MSEDAFDDQCTGANPRYPLISELKQILMDTYYGREYVEEFDREEEVAAATAPKAEKKTKSNCCLKVLPAFSDRVSKNDITPDEQPLIGVSLQTN